MAYFIDTGGEVPHVVVLPPHTRPPDTCVEINRETAIACDLRHGQRITTEQLAALQAKSVTAFHAASPLAQPQAGTSEPQRSIVVAGGISSPPHGQPLTAPVAGQVASVQRSGQSSTFRRANSVAALVEGICWLFLLISVVMGIVLATQTRLNEFTGETEHPYVAAGITVAVVGSFEALVVIMFATYIKARTEPTAN